MSLIYDVKVSLFNHAILNSRVLRFHQDSLHPRLGLPFLFSEMLPPRQTEALRPPLRIHRGHSVLALGEQSLTFNPGKTKICFFSV